LLTPIESPEEIAETPRERPLGLLCSSTGASNLFFSISKHSLFTNDNIEVKTIKNEENSESVEGDSSIISAQMVQESDLSYMPIKEENSFESPTPLNGSSYLNSPLQEETRISSPNTSRIEDEVIQSPQIKIEKISKKRTSNDVKADKKTAKRAKITKATTGIENCKKKRRTNYCFDIHRTFCPHSKKENFYCNVSLQGKLQETVDLIKGKRGKYAYTFYDHRKQRKERRYWPSQSCGPIIEDGCSCSNCHLDKVTQTFSSSQSSQEIFFPSLPAPTKLSNSMSGSNGIEDNVIFLEDVFLDM